jgi:RNA polymerase sigma-70 factor (ECF subfamily)
MMASEGATIAILEPRDGDETSASIEAALKRRDHDAALALCARQHGAAIGRLCMALVGSQADAEDLTQETLLAAHDAFDSWRGEGSIRAWLFAIARRKCARHLETRTTGRARLELLRDEPAGPNPADAAQVMSAVFDRQLAARARKALAEIRPSEREALILRYAGGLSFREVAAACGIDEAAARKRVSRAHARLRAELDPEEETTTETNGRSDR